MFKVLNQVMPFLRLRPVSNRKRLWVLLLVVLLPVNPAMAKAQFSTAGGPMQNCVHDRAAMDDAQDDKNHLGHESVSTGGLEHLPRHQDAGQHDCCTQDSCGDCSVGVGAVLPVTPAQQLFAASFETSSPPVRSVEALPALLYRPPIFV